MCELFGVSAKEKLYLNNLLKVFFSHGTDHPHGWGMAFFFGNAVSLEKEPEASHKSSYIKQRLRAEISADQMIAHIRFATKGTMDYENTHPFVKRDKSGRTWTLAHNGTVFEGDVLSPYFHIQQGRTDSERILLYLVDQINERQEELGVALTQKQRFDIVNKVIAQITPENKINLLLFDGELLYAHSNMKDTLRYCRKGQGIVLSTQALDEDNWTCVPLNTLMAFERGQCKFMGERHPNEFFENEEKLKLIFLDYANL